MAAHGLSLYIANLPYEKKMRRGRTIWTRSCLILLTLRRPGETTRGQVLTIALSAILINRNASLRETGPFKNAEKQQSTGKPKVKGKMCRSETA